MFLLERLSLNHLCFQNEHGSTALHELAESPNCDPVVLKRFLEVDEGNCFSICNKQGRKPLPLAALELPSSNEPCWDLFLEFGERFLSDKDATDEPLLNILVNLDKVAFARKLLATGKVDIREPHRVKTSTFSTAAAKTTGALDMMELLYSHDPDLATMPDDDGSLRPLDHAIHSGSSENIQFLLKLPEVDSLLDASWSNFSAMQSPRRSTDNLLVSCLEIRRLDLAKRVLRDRKVDLDRIYAEDPGVSWVLKTFNDLELLSLMVLRGIITGAGLTADHLEAMHQEVHRFFETDDWDADWKLPPTHIDPIIPFSSLASFAIHEGQELLVRFLIDSGYSDAVVNVATDPLTQERLREMDIEV